MGYLWRNACSQITKTSKSGRADSYDTDANQLFKSLNWKNLETRRQISKAEMVYKSINGLAPKYLTNKFIQRSDVNPYNLRDFENKLAILVSCRGRVRQVCSINKFC